MEGGSIAKVFSYLKPSYIFTSIFLTILTGATTFTLIVFFGESLVIPPLVEEASKLLTISYSFHFAIVYTLTFALIEFIHYINIIISETGLLSRDFLIMRTLCIMLHFFYLSIQITGFKLYYKTQWKGYIIISFITAWLLHVAWNGFFGKFVFLLIL